MAQDMRTGERSTAADPVKIYGSSSYQTYGHRSASLESAFTANDISYPNCADRRRLIT